MIIRVMAFGVGVAMGLGSYIQLARGNAVEDQMGLHPAIQAMGGAGTALAQDFAAVYYNPGALSLCNRTRVSVGYNYVSYRLDTHDTNDVSAATPNDVRGRHGLTLGGCTPLPFGFSLGGMFGVNPQHPQTLQQSTLGAQPQFVLYGRRLEQMSIMGALSYTILPGLAVGVGGSAMVNSNLVISNSVPITGDGALASTYGWDLKANPSLYAGIHFQPIDGLRFGATYRGAMAHHLNARAKTHATAAGIPFDVNFRLEADMWYSPRQVAFGVTYQAPIGSTAWDVTGTADVTWYQWSAYKGPFIRAYPDDTGTMASSLNFPPDIPPHFRSIYVPRGGIQIRWKDTWAGRFGYGYTPTPVPIPNGLTNLLDNSIHTIAMGVGHSKSFTTGPTLFKKEKTFVVHTDVYFTTMMMQERHVQKNSTAPAPQSYRYGGQIFTAGLQFSVDLQN